MKRIALVLLVLCFSANSNGQDFGIDVQSIENGLTKVYETSVNNAKSKHLLAKEWIAKTFGDYKSVLQFEDDEACKIIVKGFSPMSDDSKLSYTITIDSKDDKYRIIISDLAIKDYILQTSRMLKLDESETGLLRDLGLDDVKYIDIKYLNYVSIEDDIDRNIRKAKDIQEQIDSIDVVIREYEEKGITYDYSKKPKGVTRNLYRQRVRRGYYGATPEQLKDSIEIKRNIIQKIYLQNREYEQRIIDIENSLAELLISSYKAINTNNDF